MFGETQLENSKRSRTCLLKPEGAAVESENRTLQTEKNLCAMVRLHNRLVVLVLSQFGQKNGRILPDSIRFIGADLDQRHDELFKVLSSLVELPNEAGQARTDVDVFVPRLRLLRSLEVGDGGVDKAIERRQREAVSLQKHLFEVLALRG